MRNTVTAVAGIRTALEERANADVARDAVRQVLEDQFARLVGAFERLNEALFAKLPNGALLPKKGSVFQRLDDGSDLWLQASGRGYTDFVTAVEFERLKLWFERRHVLSRQSRPSVSRWPARRQLARFIPKAVFASPFLTPRGP